MCWNDFPLVFDMWELSVLSLIERPRWFMLDAHWLRKNTIHLTAEAFLPPLLQSLIKIVISNQGFLVYFPLQYWPKKTGSIGPELFWFCRTCTGSNQIREEIRSTKDPRFFIYWQISDFFWLTVRQVDPTERKQLFNILIKNAGPVAFSCHPPSGLIQLLSARIKSTTRLMTKDLVSTRSLMELWILRLEWLM